MKTCPERGCPIKIQPLLKGQTRFHRERQLAFNYIRIFPPENRFKPDLAVSPVIRKKGSIECSWKDVQITPNST